MPLRQMDVCFSGNVTLLPRQDLLAAVVVSSVCMRAASNHQCEKAIFLFVIARTNSMNYCMS